MKLTAREVLDMHADLQRMLARPEPQLRELMYRYAVVDVAGKPEWRASHLHPAKSMDDLKPWLESFATDLAAARTYQVSEEMVILAQALSEDPDSAVIQEEEIPSPAGFIWLDRPVPRPSDDDDGRPPLEMSAVTWQCVPELMVDVRAAGGSLSCVVPASAIRIREWQYSDDPGNYPRPLSLMGQTTLATGMGVHTRMPSHILLHMLWSLMDTEVAAHTLELPARPGRKRAASLARQDVTVVTLARARHQKPADDAPRQEASWNCTWLVRGHRRKAPDGGTFKDGRSSTWVRPYIKGPDGKPLRASDILYRLSR